MKPIQATNRLIMTTLLSLFFIAGFSTIWAAETPGSQSRVELIEEKRYKNWSVNCYGEKNKKARNCLLMQTVVLKETNSRLTQVAIVKQIVKDETQKNKKRVQETSARITLPLGIFLPNGIELQIDKAEKKRIPIIHCDQQGCHTTIRIKPELLKALKAGNQLTITFFDINQRSIGVPVSLFGFTAGINALRESP